MSEQPRLTRDYTGATECGLEIERAIGLRPGERHYAAKCVRCGRKSYVSQLELSSRQAKCVYGACHRANAETIKQQYTREQRQARERETSAALQREQHRREALEAAEAENKRLQSKIGQAVRERILKMRDDEFPHDAEANKLRLSEPDAQAYNVAEIKKLLLNRRDIRLDNPAVVDALNAYLTTNGCHLRSARTLAAAYDRLVEFGVIVLSKPPSVAVAPQPQPSVTAQNAPAPEPEQPPVSEPKPSDQPFSVNTFWGRDAQGRPHEFTEYEVEQMSPAEYKWSFVFRR